MQNIAVADRIATLLANYATRQITPKEQKELAVWTSENEENKRLCEKLADANLIETAEIMRLLKFT